MPPMPPKRPTRMEGNGDGRELYSLLTNILFCLPTNPGAAAVYVRATTMGQPVNNAPLSRTEQALIDTLFNRRKHYFLLMQNIERACFTTLDSSINDAFKVSNDPTVHGWHAGMRVINILDQLSLIYGQPTPTALEANDHIFRSPTSAADDPEVLFRCIEECAKIALLGQNPYTDKQLITNTIRAIRAMPLPFHSSIMRLVLSLAITRMKMTPLLTQVERQLLLLRQSRAHPNLSAYAHVSSICSHWHGGTGPCQTPQTPHLCQTLHQSFCPGHVKMLEILDPHNTCHTHLRSSFLQAKIFNQPINHAGGSSHSSSSTPLQHSPRHQVPATTHL